MDRSGVKRLQTGGLALFAALVAACASGSGGSGSGGGGNANLITREQILELPNGTALSVVQRYRSSWLRPRSQGTFAGASRAPRSGVIIADSDQAIVFLDDIRFGEIESLARISSTNIESIEFISALDATTSYGTGYNGGIIRVNTIESN